MRKNNTAIIFGGLFFSCSVMAGAGTLAPTVVPMVNGGQASIAISNTSPNLFTVPALNLATSDAAAVAGLVMTVLTVGLVSCAGKSLPRFWPGDFFPTFYACHLAVLGVLAL
ncbi:TPA: hypothetical protein JZ872_004252 [Escherichia coli]|nr:hypothetical protein [Escherichia coli]